MEYSQDIKEAPADWDALPVEILVANNSKEVAMDAGKHVLVEVYRHYKDSADIVIARERSTANEPEIMEVNNFFTLGRELRPQPVPAPRGSLRPKPEPEGSSRPPPKPKPRGSLRPVPAPRGSLRPKPEPARTSSSIYFS